MNDYDRAHDDITHTFRWARALNWIIGLIAVISVIVLAAVSR